MATRDISMGVTSGTGTTIGGQKFLPTVGTDYFSRQRTRMRKEEERKKKEKERRDRMAKQRKRSFSLLTGYTDPTTVVPTLLPGDVPFPS